MGALGSIVANDALSNVGVTEDGDNRGQWVETYQRAVGIPPGAPWCAAFVRYRFEQASTKSGFALPEGMPDSGWVPSYVAWARRTGRWVPVATARQTPSMVTPGMLCCFWFPAKDRHAHIGIVVATGTSMGVVTVEGNTGLDKGADVERDGDGVYRKRRTWGSFGTQGGFIRITE